MRISLNNKGMWIDLLNMVIGLAIIVLAVLAILKENGGGETCAVVFALGAVMFLLNAAKAFPHSRIRAILFCSLSVFLIASCLLAAGMIRLPA